MPLIYAILALNLAFVVYLFVSLRNNPEASQRKSRVQAEQDYPFYDAFSNRQPLYARSRSNSGQY